jgi:hypothetical protein
MGQPRDGALITAQIEPHEWKISPGQDFRRGKNPVWRESEQERSKERPLRSQEFVDYGNKVNRGRCDNMNTFKIQHVIIQ